MRGTVENKSIQEQAGAITVGQLFDINEALTYQQASRFTKLSERSLKKKVAAGQIPHWKDGRAVRFRVSSLIRWMEERETA